MQTVIRAGKLVCLYSANHLKTLLESIPGGVKSKQYGLLLEWRRLFSKPSSNFSVPAFRLIKSELEFFKEKGKK